MNVETCNLDQPTVFIVMSGWNDKYNRDAHFHFKIPYSSHSNHREIERFVAAIRPKHLVYHVTDRENVSSRFKFQDYLQKKYSKFYDIETKRQKSKFLIPKTVSSEQAPEEEYEEAALDDEALVKLAKRFDKNDKSANTERFLF